MQRFLSDAASRPDAFMTRVFELVTEIVELSAGTLPCGAERLLGQIPGGLSLYTKIAKKFAAGPEAVVA